MSTNYSLNYFNRIGKIELVKLMFAVSNVNYDDKYIENLTDSDTQFGFMPYLKVNDVKIPLISVICRYLAREFRLAGTNNIDQAKCDAIATNIMLLIDHYYDKVWLVEDRDTKRIGLKSFIDNECESCCKEVENLIKQYRSTTNDKFCIGKDLTYADLFVWEMCTNYLPKDKQFRERFPLMHSVWEQVNNDNRVTTYMKTVKERPDYLDINKI